jgi:hypothetical protein
MFTAQDNATASLFLTSFSKDVKFISQDKKKWLGRI